MKKIEFSHQGQKVYYGWWVALSCFLLLFMGYGLSNGPFSLYMIPVTEALDISRTQFSAVQSLRCVTVSTVNLIFGFLSQRLSWRKLLTIGCSGWIIAFLLFGSARIGFTFVLGGLFMGLGFSLASTAVISALVKNWFHAHQGLILGIIFAGTGLGSSLFSIVVEGWIADHGWRSAYFLCAGLLLVAAIVVISVVRNSPAEKGLIPYGDPPGKQQEKPNYGITFVEACRKPSFYLMLISMFLIGMLNNPIYVAAPVIIVDAGYTSEFSAQVLSVFFISVACCKVLLGFSYDKLGLRNTLRFSLAANTLGILCLLLAKGPGWYWAFAVLFGISLPLETVLMPLIVTTVFGEKDFATFVGVGLALASAGMAVGNPLLNSFFDHLGTYQGVLAIFVGLSLVLWVTLTISSRKKFYSRNNG